ncbi:MAG: hypothetical protein II670_11640, partial [Alphaproteobacteria bacterium]|nr:hypothetical protein [Alphaproteobacteria bacterium]
MRKVGMFIFGVVFLFASCEGPYVELAPDEGMTTETEWVGEYGPYIQSKRGEIYRAYAKYMIEQGKAYPCF